MAEYNEVVEVSVNTGALSGSMPTPSGVVGAVSGDALPEFVARMHPVWGPEIPKIAYVGPMLYPTGYGEAARSHVKALSTAGAGVMAHLNQIPHPGLKHELITDDHEINERLDEQFWPIHPDQRKPHAWVVHTTADEARRHASDVPFLVYSVWETAGLPRGWADACNRMDAVLTCSEFSAGLFRDGGVTVPVLVSPHPIDVSRFYPSAEGVELRKSFGDVKTLFLVVSQWMFRKGVEDVINAFTAEFNEDEGAGLVLLSWRWSHAWAEKQVVKQFIQFMLRAVNKPTPPIWFIGDKIPQSALPVLYSAADCLVTGTRGEAMGLPIFEAAACSRPSIATGWGGMWDYLDSESGYPIPYEMETVHGAGPKWRHYGTWQKWARPNLDALRAAMRRVHENKDEREAKGAKAKEIVVERLNPVRAGREMLAAIGKVVDIPGDWG